MNRENGRGRLPRRWSGKRHGPPERGAASELARGPRQGPSRRFRFLLFSTAEPPDRVRSQNPFRLVLIMPLAEEAEVVQRVRAAPRVGHDVIDLEVVRGVAALAS